MAIAWSCNDSSKCSLHVPGHKDALRSLKVLRILDVYIYRSHIFGNTLVENLTRL